MEIPWLVLITIVLTDGWLHILQFLIWTRAAKQRTTAPDGEQEDA